jgi:hypothetical protein
MPIQWRYNRRNGREVYFHQNSVLDGELRSGFRLLITAPDAVALCRSLNRSAHPTAPTAKEAAAAGWQNFHHEK